MKFNQSDCGPVDALLTWGGDHFLDNKLDPVDSVDGGAKATMDALDSLLLTGSPPSSNFAELKPLPPFSTYTGNITVNGMGNGGVNHYPPAPSPQSTMGVPSSTSGRQPSIEANNNNPTLYKCMPSQSNGAAIYYANPNEQVSSSADGVVSGNILMKQEPVDYILGAPDIEDIAAIIGNAIADTTVPNVNVEGLDPADTRDSWMDLDAWIDTACSADKHEGLEMNAQFVSPSLPVASSTLQTLLTQGPSHTYNNQPHHQTQLIKRDYHNHMPLLQSRLQNGGLSNGLGKADEYGLKSDPSYGIKIEAPYSPPCVINKDILPHTTHASPPGHVSTTDTSGVLNGRFQRKQPYIRTPGMKDLNGSLDGFPKIKPKSRSGKSSKLGGAYTDGAKEKPVHRCTICNRGFLNKSNIKVHLRTHTGEKPFRCETCGKAFRQKAHLIKHQQIHKRVGRD